MEMSEANWDRQEFLKKAGIGVAAGGSLGALLALPDAAEAAGQRVSFRWMSLSNRAHEGDPADVVIMNGEGFVTRGGRVEAKGSYNNIVGGGPPVRPFGPLGFGTWKATKLVKLDLIGRYGAFAAGRVVMRVKLVPQGKSNIRARVTMNCNIPPKGLFTGLNEGFYLRVGEKSFQPVLQQVVGPPGQPPPPPLQVGATIITIFDEERDQSPV